MYGLTFVEITVENLITVVPCPPVDFIVAVMVGVFLFQSKTQDEIQAELLRSTSISGPDSAFTFI
jgi:hypothetical protein